MSIAPALPESSPVPGETCPRCHTTQEWGESSWCPNCSFYPVVDGSAGGQASWADNLPDLPEEEVADDRSALESIPLWFWGMLAGVVGVTGFSVVIRLSFPDEDSPRGMIALVQLSIGLITMMVAHGFASRHALKNDRRLNFNDVLLSWFNVWQPTIAELPATCRRVQAMAWGGFAVLTAVTIIGGIDYSAPFRTHKEPDIKPMKIIGAAAAAAKAKAEEVPEDMNEALADLQSEVSAVEEAAQQQAAAGGPKGMEEALSELDQTDESLTTADGLAGDEAEQTEQPQQELQLMTLTCFIYGVETDQQNVPRAFLFAGNTLGSDQHVARIAAADLEKDVFRTIAVQLYTAIRPQPVIPSTAKAVWVEPILQCSITCYGITDEGELKDPEFDAIVPGRPAIAERMAASADKAATAGESSDAEPETTSPATAPSGSENSGDRAGSPVDPLRRSALRRF
ncbi:MAG: hypothetical protein Fues2KO_40550 [Fuerstiella sp.]